MPAMNKFSELITSLFELSKDLEGRHTVTNVEIFRCFLMARMHYQRFCVWKCNSQSFVSKIFE